MAVLVNSILLVCIALDRYMAVVRIVKGTWEPSKLCCITCCVIIWGFSAAVSSPLLTIYDYFVLYIVPLPDPEDDNPVLTYYVGHICGSDKVNKTSPAKIDSIDSFTGWERLLLRDHFLLYFRAAHHHIFMAELRAGEGSLEAANRRGSKCEWKWKSINYIVGMESPGFICLARNDSASSSAQTAANQNVQSHHRPHGCFLHLPAAKLDLYSLPAEHEIWKQHPLGDKLCIRPHGYGKLHVQSFPLHISERDDSFDDFPRRSCLQYFWALYEAMRK